jgi:hypothetical protein
MIAPTVRLALKSETGDGVRPVVLCHGDRRRADAYPAMAFLKWLICHQGEPARGAEVIAPGFAAAGKGALFVAHPAPGPR